MSLEVNKISKCFGQIQALDGMSFSAKQGQILGLIGPNGAGKSTAFRIVLSLLSPDQGEVLWNNRTNIPKESIGYLPEERGLYPKMKLIDLLYLFGQAKGRNRQWLKPRIEHWISHFNLDHRKNDKCETLSKGNQQKVQIIMSFLHEPELLILDEPFSGLDPVNVDFLKSSVLQVKNSGCTIIFSSHRMDHVEELCENIILLNEGRTLFYGSIKELKKIEGKRQLSLNADLPLSLIQSFPGVEHVIHTPEKWVLTLDKPETAKLIFPKSLTQNNIRTNSVWTISR